MDDEVENILPRSLNETLDNMMGAAWEEVRGDFNSGTNVDRAASTAKFIGKGSLYLGVKFVQNLPSALQRMKEQQNR